MALTRHSVRTCFLWKGRSADFGPAPRVQRLWEAFLSCLESIQDPAAEESAVPAPAMVETSVASFLRTLVGTAEDRSAVEELAATLNEYAAIDALEVWRSGKDGKDAARTIFREAINQGATAFFLGQLAFVFGRLELARSYSLDAYGLLLKASSEEVGTVKPLHLRILEFLTVTLLLEVSFHSQGYDIVRGQNRMPQARRIYLDLTHDRRSYLEDFPRLEDLGIEVRNGHGSDSDLASEYVKHFWLPIPTDRDFEHLEFATDPGARSPLALAYVLSRKTRAGMLLFRYRKWQQAEKEFSEVYESILRERDRSGRRDPVLVPLEHEALLYLGRIRAQACDFIEAESRIETAKRYFERIRDEFAKNKARKALAELAYRSFHWMKAEKLFTQVSEDSLAKGFAHDWAAAEMYLGKMLSRFGFQADAASRFAAANKHFRHYDVLRETLDCLFWEAVTHARTLDLTGHPRQNVIEAYAIMTVYRHLFERVATLPPDDPDDTLIRLREGLEDQRHPDVADTMLQLRLGYMPGEDLIDRLKQRVKSSHTARSSWPRTAEARLINQVLRLVHLQRVERPPKVGRAHQRDVASSEHNRRLLKLKIRDELLTALEGVVRSTRGNLPCLSGLHAAYLDTEKLGLGGGLVPFLVDISQFFIDRDCFIALLLLLQRMVDSEIRSLEKRSQLDPKTLKKIYRSLTKYFVLERNFYLGPPNFQGQKNPELWRALQERHAVPDWSQLYRFALRGGYGIWYPDTAVGLGWVESLDSGGATLRIVWVDRIYEGPLSIKDFRRIEVPTDVVAQGHALESMTPVVLIGRHGEPSEEASHCRPWTAHRIPIDLDMGELIRDLEHAPWYEPVPEGWQALLERFTGQTPARCESPELGQGAREAINRRFAELARTWFGERFSPLLFKRIFGLGLTIKMDPNRPKQAQRTTNVLVDFPDRRRPNLQKVNDFLARAV